MLCLFSLTLVQLHGTIEPTNFESSVASFCRIQSLAIEIFEGLRALDRLYSTQLDGCPGHTTLRKHLRDCCETALDAEKDPVKRLADLTWTVEYFERTARAWPDFGPYAAEFKARLARESCLAYLPLDSEGADSAAIPRFAF